MTALVREYLLETLKTMDLTVGPEMTFSAITARKHINETAEITDAAFATFLKSFVDVFL